MKRCIIGLILMPALLAAEPVWNEGEHGLWRLQFADGTYLSAADVATNGCGAGRAANVEVCGAGRAAAIGLSAEGISCILPARRRLS